MKISTLLLLVSNLICRSIKLTILYEKQVENTVGETYRIYLEQLIKSINDTICKTRKDEKELDQIKIELDAILAHNQYKDIPLYGEISRYAGSNNINARVKALSEIQNNIILAISTTLEQDMDDYSSPIVPCEKISYMVNLDSQVNFDNDLLTNLHYGVLHVLKQLFGFDAPNLLDKKNVEEKSKFIKKIQNMDLSRWKKCMDEDRKDDGYRKDEDKFPNEDDGDDIGLKSSLIKSDKFVNEFGKLINLLKKNDDNDSKSPLGESNKEEKDTEDHDKKEKYNYQNTSPKEHRSEKDEEDYDKKEKYSYQNAPLRELRYEKDKEKNNEKLDNSYRDKKPLSIENSKNYSEPNYYRDLPETKPFIHDTKNDQQMGTIFTEILHELKNLRYDISESNNKRNEFSRQPPHDKDLYNNRRRSIGGYTNRNLGELKTESVASLDFSKNKNYQPLNPFGYIDKKTDITDLKSSQISKKTTNLEK